MSDIFLGKGEHDVYLLSRYGNRHGLVAGATGTGKSVSLMVLADGFSRLGVPVFMADVKGDIAGMAAAGTTSEKLQKTSEERRVGTECVSTCRSWRSSYHYKKRKQHSNSQIRTPI